MIKVDFCSYTITKPDKHCKYVLSLQKIFLCVQLTDGVSLTVDPRCGGLEAQPQKPRIVDFDQIKCNDVVYLPIYLLTLNLMSQVAKCMFSNSKVLSEYALAY